MAVNAAIHSVAWARAVARVKTAEAGSPAKKRSPAEAAAGEAAARVKPAETGSRAEKRPPAEVAAGEAAASAAARERGRSSERNNHRDSGKRRGDSLQLCISHGKLPS